MQRAPSSCSPPLGVAANCATRKGRRSSAQSTAKSIAQLTAQIQAQCSAQRGAKTDYGFRAPNRHSPRLASVLRPVSASLRLRLRSAAFSRAWGNPVKTHKRVLTISLLRRGARLSYRRGLPLRRAGGASRHSEWAASAQFRVSFFVRAPCAIHLYSARAEIAESLL